MSNIKNILSDEKVSTKTVALFITMLIYKLALELGYYNVLADKIMNFTLDFDLSKFIVGFIWVCVLFFLIDHTERKASTFFLELYIFIAMIPITIWYSFCDESSVYYNFVCAGFAFCEILIKEFRRIRQKRDDMLGPDSLQGVEKREFRIHEMPKGMIFCMLIIMAGVLVYTLASKGLPTLTALNLKDVYEIRSENYFITNKYVGYIYNWMMYVMAPFILAYCLFKKKYIYSAFCVGYIFLFYLYSGNKQTLFSVFIIIGTYFFMRLKDGDGKFFRLFTLGVIGTVTISSMRGMDMFFSLFIRRTMILPAELKFKYYDFFCNNPKLGFSGIFPGFLSGVTPYGDGAGKAIGAVYFDAPDMNANTGFMAEGFYRFGYIGIFIAFAIFAFLLIMLDRLQGKTNYVFVITMSIYAVYTLNDLPLISSILLGPMLVLVLICVLFYDDDIKKEKFDHGIKICSR